MTYADEIKEWKESAVQASTDYTVAVSSVIDCFETRIMHLDADLEEARQETEDEKALTKKLKGLLDGGLVELVGELITALDATMLYIDADSVLKHHAGPVRETLAKAKEVMQS